MRHEQLAVWEPFQERCPSQSIAPVFVKKVRDYAWQRGYTQVTDEGLIHPSEPEWCVTIEGVRVLCQYLLMGDAFGGPPGYYVRADMLVKRTEEFLQLEAMGL